MHWWQRHLLCLELGARRDITLLKTRSSPVETGIGDGGQPGLLLERAHVAGGGHAFDAAWLKPEVMANTAYHQTGMFTVAGDPLNPFVP